uniref:WASH1 WAHD domain-containing protein n=1 Tax=Aplanochytrium stocchinoi TaxID=215587 RepID=A0A6S8ASS3_9STRA
MNDIYEEKIPVPRTCLVEAFEDDAQRDAEIRQVPTEIAGINKVMSISKYRNNNSDEMPLGLGSLPHKLESISSLILFNTCENPYDEYHTTDNLVGIGTVDEDTFKRKNEQEKKQKIIHDAPTSLLDGEMLPEIGEYDVGFKPKMKQMAAFALPSNLDLPDIADINFSSDNAQSSIAPSVQREAAIPDFPRILGFVSPNALVEPLTKRNTQNVSQKKDEVETTKERTQILPPPPPPKSAPPANVLKVSDVRKQPRDREASSPSKVEVPKASGSKLNLLSAIRDKDNLARLKSSAEQKRMNKENDSSSPEKKEERPLSIAEEMRIKLLRRQKALSGQQDEEEQALARQRQLNAPIRAVHVAGKLMSMAKSQSAKSQVTLSPRSSFKERKKLENTVSPTLFDLDNVRGLDDYLEVRHAQDETGGNHNDIWSDDNSDDWDED